MNNKSVFLSNLHYFYAQMDGTYAFPNSSEGDLLKTAKKEIEENWVLFRRDISKILNRVVELENENAKLREDKERLDCLERLGEKGTDIFIDRDHPMYAIRIWPKIGPGPQYDGDNLRAAIDSWRKHENEKKSQITNE
jgi:hypothetical protein